MLPTISPCLAFSSIVQHKWFCTCRVNYTWLKKNPALKMLFFRGMIYPIISSVGRQACKTTRLVKNPKIQGQSRHFCTFEGKLSSNSHPSKANLFQVSRKVLCQELVHAYLEKASHVLPYFLVAFRLQPPKKHKQQSWHAVFTWTRHLLHQKQKTLNNRWMWVRNFLQLILKVFRKKFRSRIGCFVLLFWPGLRSGTFWSSLI